MGWLAMADTNDRSRNLTHAVPTCSRHNRRHRGKRHEHQQRREAGGRREARQILWGEVTAAPGAPERSRTPKPQIRRLVTTLDFKGVRLNHTNASAQEDEDETTRLESAGSE